MSSVERLISMTLPLSPRGPGTARQMVRTRLEQLDQDLLGELVLLTSEVLSDSVRQAEGAGTCELTVEERGGALVVSVARPFEAPWPASPWAATLLDRIAVRWGITPLGEGPGSRIWFEVGKRGEP